MSLGELISSLGINHAIYLTLAAVGLAVVVIIDQAQLLAKYVGILKGRIAGGYNSAMKIMVINRFGAVLYFLFIAISIDLGASAAVIARFYAFVAITIFLADITISLFMMRIYKVRMRSLLKAGISLAPIGMTLIATVFGILGQTVPMLLGAENHDIRLTMANTGFLFNAVFTIMTVFFIESYLAELIDDSHGNEKMTAFVILVFLMRALAALICLAVMIFMIYNSFVLDIGYWLT